MGRETADGHSGGGEGDLEPLPQGLVLTSHFDSAKKRMGPASELRAAVHLMRQGFDVFRCVGPHAPFDLVAYRNGQLYRVEVKTLSKSKSDSFVPPFGWPVNDEWDLVVLCGDGVIFQWSAGVTREEARLQIAESLQIVRKVPPEPRRGPRGGTDGLVLSLILSGPSREWSAPGMLGELLHRGWATQAREPAGAVADSLRRIARRGLIKKIAQGLYVLTSEINEERVA
jgi:hypothetical protein